MKFNWIFIKCILKVPNSNRIFIKFIIKLRYFNKISSYMWTEKNVYSGSTSWYSIMWQASYIFGFNISKYLSVIYNIFIFTYLNISDSEAESTDITVQYIEIRSKYKGCLAHSWISIFLRVHETSFTQNAKLFLLKVSEFPDTSIRIFATL